MAIYTSAPLTDPDSLTYLAVNGTLTSSWSTYAAASDELIIDYGSKTIGVLAVGSMNQDGVTIKCVYSKLKEIWRTDSTLVKFPFPMGPITDEQFEMINGWNWDKTNTSGAASQTTVELLRTGGWSVVKPDAPNAGAILEEWAGIITLGTFVATTDQAYYQQSAGGAPTNFKLTNNVNQAVQIYSDPNGDGSTADGYNRRGYFKVFLREYAKTYVQSANTEIGASTMTYQAYRFPLANAVDTIKITHTDAAVGGVATSSGSWSGGSATINTTSAHGLVTGDVVTISGVTPSGYNGTYTITVSDTDTFTYTVADPGGVITVQGTVVKDVYNDINITYLRHTDDTLYNIRGAHSSASISYALADVVQGTNNRWYKCILAHTSSASNTPITGGTYATNWAAYEGERKIGANWYAFTTIIDADVDVASTASGTALRTEVYEKTQYLLRQNSDIDADASASVTGKTADTLLYFVGDTLVTKPGVYIDSFNSIDTNDIEFYDYSNTKRTFPYVATITLNFGDNLKGDASAKYWLFFTTLPGAGNDFGESGAVLVQNADETPANITGDVSGASSVTWTFDYDNNTQGGRSSASTADVTAVALGLNTGQYVKATGTIAKSKANSVSLVAALERNYKNT